MVTTRTARHQEESMPPSRRKRTQTETVEAKGITITPLGADGAPRLADRRILPDATVTMSIEPEDTTDVADVQPLGHIEQTVTVEVPPEVAKLLTRIPIPTAVIDRWFPAFVRWPGEPEPLTTCRVYLTPQGVYVYKRVPAEPETFADGARPDRYATVMFEKTGKPPIGTVARNAGIRLETAAGPVIVQPTGTCGCGNRLKHWAPDWATKTISWEDGVKLVTDATEGR